MYIDQGLKWGDNNSIHAEQNFEKWEDNVPCILIKVKNGGIISQYTLSRILQNGRITSYVF